jgi:putative MATE family efflux protein
MIRSLPPPQVTTILERPENSAIPESITPALKRETLRRVLAMGLPSMASFLLLTIYELIDIFWLAKLGEEPVAAVTVFSAFLWVLAFANQIVGTGSVAVISRRFGERDDRRTEISIKNTFLAKLAVGAAFGVIGIFLIEEALSFLGADPVVRDLGVQYGRIQCAFLGISLASFSVYTALRGIGRPTLGMWTGVAGTVVNLAFDPLLIFGIGPFPALGIVGASIASALGFLTVTVWGLIALGSRRSPVQVHWFRPPRPDLSEMMQMVRIGLPSGVSGLSFALSASIIVKLVAIYGTTVVALFGMSQKIVRFGIMLLAGLGLGSSALIGQYLGSKHLHRAWLSAVITMQLGSVTMLAFAVFVWLFAPQLVAMFFGEEGLIGSGKLYLRMLALGLPFVGLTIGSEQAYAGAGKNTPPMVMHMVSSWVLTIPIMYLFGETLRLGPAGMMAGNSLGLALGAMIGVWLVRRGSWLEHRV